MCETRPRFVPTSLLIPLRIVSRSSGDRWRSEVVGELSEPFEPDAAPLMRVMFLRGPETSELIFTVHHSIGDGLSTLYFVRDLLRAINREPLEKLPSPPPADTFVLSSAPSTVPQLSAGDESLPVPDRPGAPVITTADLDAETLQQLIRRSRLEGTTVHGAFTAALLLSARSEFKAEDPISALQPVSLRSINSQMAESLALYLTAGIVSLEKIVETDVWDFARSIKKQLEPALDPQVLSAGYSALRALVSANPTPSEAYSHYRRGVRYHLVVSNKGRLPFETQVGRLRIDAIWSVPNVESEPFISLLTVGDRMFITAVAQRSMRNLLDATLARIRHSIGWPETPITENSNRTSKFAVSERLLGV